MSMKLAIAGFRHGHIFSLIEEARRLGIEIVAAVEEDTATRESLAGHEKVTITHSSFEKMLHEVPFDILGIGDYYARRGSLAVQGLQAGKHIIADKPLCTSIADCDLIASLAAEKKRSVSCMFGMRSSPTLQAMKKAIADGAIGTVRTLCITGQHPLMLGTRPAWYFEEGKHGGTINDIGIHAVDLIPWLTGLQIKEICAARSWNAKAVQTPWFKDCAQVMLKLDNDAGVIADFSYLSPDQCGYAVRQYWRITVHGDKGVLEHQNGDSNLMFANSESTAPETIPCSTEAQPDTFLEQLIREIEGKTIPGQLTTDYVLKTSRKTLEIQQEAKLF
jgi:predicted dehydrogenase